MGISQAWSGQRKDEPGAYEVTPSAQDLLTQALSFCQHGAIAVTCYAWYDSTVASFPWNTPAINQGIQQGIAACQQYWNAQIH